MKNFGGMKVAYVGGNIAQIGAYRFTMTELRSMMEHLEAEYREKSCCPSCGTLTLTGETCADCLRYEESAYTCEHAVPIGHYCPKCEEEAAALAELGL